MNFIPRMRPKPKKRTERIRCQAHLNWIGKLQCSVMGCTYGPAGMVIHAHHVRLGSHAGSGQKPDDDRVIPLCAFHHDEAHHGEASFARKYDIDLQWLADKLRDLSPHRHKLTRTTP